jgi:hypothetical protein
MAEDKFFDVAKPGKTAPDQTSRPIIVGHGARIKQDPMVSDSSTSQPDKEETKITESKAVHEKVVAPIDEVVDSKTKDEPKEEPKPEPEPKPEDKPSDAAVVEAVVEQAGKKKPKDAKTDELSEEEKARRKHIEKLVANKTYFLPIGQITRKKNARNSLIAIVLLAVVLGGAAYFAYSQGLINGLG